jgi:hypothetical protein
VVALDAKGTSPIRFDAMVGMRFAAVHCQGELPISHTRFPKASAVKPGSCERLGCFLGRYGNGGGAAIVARAAEPPAGKGGGTAVMAQARRNRRHGKGAGQARVPIAIQVPSGIGGRDVDTRGRRV